MSKHSVSIEEVGNGYIVRTEGETVSSETYVYERFADAMQFAATHFNWRLSDEDQVEITLITEGRPNE